jgi:hypothetical protein
VSCEDGNEALKKLKNVKRDGDSLAPKKVLKYGPRGRLSPAKLVEVTRKKKRSPV